MKMDTTGNGDPRIILRETFRSRQEVIDHGFQIVGTALSFNGNGVTFTGAGGNRLYLPASPSSTTLMLEFSANILFTPGWDASSTSSYTFFEQDNNYGYCTFYTTIDLYCAPPHWGYRISCPAATVKSNLRYAMRNCLSYSIKNGEQKIWLNGTQIASTTSGGIMPSPATNILRGLVIGSSSLAAGYASPFNGTIHMIEWRNYAMTLEEHIDTLQNDMYSETW